MSKRSIETALAYISAGLSIIPIRCSDDPSEAKRPAVSSWKEFQSRIMNSSEVETAFAATDRVALVAGNVSGNLEILDFDEPGLCQRWFQEIQTIDYKLADSLYVEKSPSGGHHVIYRSVAKIQGNHKIAMRPTDSGESVLIETRGEGGYCLVQPTPEYEAKRGSILRLPVLSQGQRELLISIAAKFDERPTKVRPDRRHSSESKSGSNRPGDDFNLRGDWYELLEKHGWTLHSQRGAYDYWTRPGKESGVSASLKWSEEGSSARFFVFSSSTNFSTFAEKSYDLFGAYALLEHDDDFASAAAALRELGFGHEEDNRVSIRYEPENLHLMVLRSLESLERANDPPRWFVRNRRLVRIDSSGEPAICEVNQPQLAEVLSSKVKFFKEKITKDSVERISIAPPDKVVQCLYQRQVFSEIPQVKGLVTSPLLLPRGEIITSRGYIPEIQMYKSTDDPIEVTDVTEVDVRRAVEWIDEALIDFPFADEASRANAFAAILTPVIRPYLEDATPFLRIEAFQQGTGKSLLAKTIIAFTYPYQVGATEYSKDEGEFAKKLQAMVASSKPFIFIDNVVGRVQSQALDSIITERKIAFRELGNNTTPISAECTGEILLTANNCHLSRDLALRGYTILLDAKCSNPEQRTGFKYVNPARHVLDSRGEASRSVVTLIRWWLQQGKPLASEASKLIRFNKWAQVVGGILQTAGIEGFLENQQRMVQSADPEADAWRAFYQKWHEELGSKPVRVGAVMDFAFGPKTLSGSRDMEQGLLTEFFTYAKGEGGLLAALGKKLPRGVFAVTVGDESTLVQLKEMSIGGHNHYALLPINETTVTQVTEVTKFQEASDEVEPCSLPDNFFESVA